MSLLSQTATKLLGPSWKTTLLGLLGAASQAAGAYIVTTNIPMDDSAKMKVWLVGGASAVFTAVKGYYTKDHDK